MIKSRISKDSKKQQLFDKISRLLASGRRTALNVQCDQNRFYGQMMKDLKMDEKGISFKYNQKDHYFSFNSIKLIRRLRTKKYLLCFEVQKGDEKKEQIKEEKKESFLKKKSTKKKKTKEE
jgi:hypothetical protein